VRFGTFTIPDELIGIVGGVVAGYLITNSQQYKSYDTTTTTSVGLDKFGIKKLFPDYGPKWFARWDNGKPRTIKSTGTISVAKDPSDSMAKFLCLEYAKEKNMMSIDGKGEMRLQGMHPRLYVYDGSKKWLNTEMTCYCKLVSPMVVPGAYTTFRLCTRSNHHAITKCICNGTGYSSEFFLPAKDQRFRKELTHPHYANWPFASPNPGLNVWFGQKFVVRNSGYNKVRLQCYIDLTDGLDGGDWQLVGEYTDDGNWPIESPKELANIATDVSKCRSGCLNPKPVSPYNRIITETGVASYLRTDYVNDIRFKKMSVREIAAG